MKSFIALSTLLLLLASCSHIYYEEVQPKGGVYLSGMPDELVGTWFTEQEGWQLSENGITNIDFRTDSLDNRIDTLYKTTPLSDSLRFYRAEDLYVLNSRENRSYWEIIIFEPLANGDINVYVVSDPKIVASIKGVKLEEAIYYVDGEPRSGKTLEPEAEGSLRFSSALFSGQMKYKSLIKTLISIPPTILRKDGTIFSTENDAD